MVLTIGKGGAAGSGRTPGPPGRDPARRGHADQDHAGSECGSQALEFAMVLPLLGMALVLLTQTGLLLGDVLVVHGIAREAARAAAIDGDVGARELADRLARSRDVRVDIDRSDGLVRARVELATRAFAAAGVDLWLPARATFRDEAADVGLPLPARATFRDGAAGAGVRLSAQAAFGGGAADVGLPLPARATFRDEVATGG